MIGEIYEPRDKSKKLTEEEDDKIADRVFNHITRAGETAVFKFDEDSAVAILGTVAEICKVAVEGCSQEQIQCNSRKIGIAIWGYWETRTFSRFIYNHRLTCFLYSR